MLLFPIWSFTMHLGVNWLQDKQGRNDEEDEDEFADFYENDDEDDDQNDEEDDEPMEKKRFHLAKRKAIKPTSDEMVRNPRSRSARLRCLERVA